MKALRFVCSCLAVVALGFTGASCSSPASGTGDSSVAGGGDATNGQGGDGSTTTGSDGGSGSGNDGGGGAVGDGGVSSDAALPSCDPHAVSAAPHFTDQTAAWGLSNVTGNRIVAVDLDGDGYPDLVIHAIGNNNRETIVVDAGVGSVDATVAPPPKLVWVLMNRPRPGGGRQFVDETLESGVFALAGSTTQLRSAHIAVAGDIDNDGDLDLFSGTYVDMSNAPAAIDYSTVMLNDGTGHFTAAPTSGPGQYARSTSGATLLDWNRDGKLDLFVGFWYEPLAEVGYQHELFSGNGDGTFTRVTTTTGLVLDESGSLDSLKAGTNTRPAYGVTSCDVDDDGAPDLLVSAYGRQWNMLYRNAGTRFNNVSKSSHFNGDDDLDYHDNQMFLCYCDAHKTDPDCAGVPKPQMVCTNYSWTPGQDDQPYRLNGNTFTTVCADIDGDGKLDLYNAEIHHWWAGQSADSSQLLVNKGVPGAPSFARPGNDATGMTWLHPTVDWNEGGLMAAATDLDNDGRADVVVAASDYPDQFGLLFHQMANGKFEETGEVFGIHHACVSGLAIADFDRDGDLDVVVGSGTARDCHLVWSKNEVHLYENDASTKGSWLAVRLQGDGTTANRSAIGAKVTLTAGGVSQVKEVGGGYGHMGQQNDLVLFFGLGACAQVDSISVRWPNSTNTVETWTGVQAKRLIELRQGDTAVHEVVLQ